MHVELRDLFGRNAYRGSAMTSPTTSFIDQSKVRFPSETVRQENQAVPLQWRPIRDTSIGPKGAQKTPSRWVKSWGAGMDNVRGVKKHQKEERKEDKGSTHRSQGSKYRSQIKHDTHVIGPSWTLDINWQDSSKRREWAIQRLRGRKVM